MLKRQLLSSVFALFISISPAYSLGLSDYRSLIDNYRSDFFRVASARGLNLHKVSVKPEIWKSDESMDAFPVVGSMRGANFLFEYIFGGDKVESVVYSEIRTLPTGQSVQQYQHNVFTGFQAKYGPAYKCITQGDTTLSRYDLGDLLLDVSITRTVLKDKVSLAVGFVHRPDNP